MHTQTDTLIQNLHRAAADFCNEHQITDARLRHHIIEAMMHGALQTLNWNSERITRDLLAVTEAAEATAWTAPRGNEANEIRRGLDRRPDLMTPTVHRSLITLS